MSRRTRSSRSSTSWTSPTAIDSPPFISGTIDDSKDVMASPTHTGRGHRRRLRRGSINSDFDDSESQPQRSRSNAAKSSKKVVSSTATIRKAKTETTRKSRQKKLAINDNDDVENTVVIRSKRARKRKTQSTILVESDVESELDDHDDDDMSTVVSQLSQSSTGSRRSSRLKTKAMDVEESMGGMDIQDDASVASQSSRGSRRSSRNKSTKGTSVLAAKKQKSVKKPAKTPRAKTTRPKKSAKKTTTRKRKLPEMESPQEENTIPKTSIKLPLTAIKLKSARSVQKAKQNRRMTIGGTSFDNPLMPAKTPKRRRTQKTRIEPLEDAIQYLTSKKVEWANSSILDRCHLLEDLESAFQDNCAEWVQAICQARGFTDSTETDLERAMAECYTMEMLPVSRLINQYLHVLQLGLQDEEKGNMPTFGAGQSESSSTSLTRMLGNKVASTITSPSSSSSSMKVVSPLSESKQVFEHGQVSVVPPLYPDVWKSAQGTDSWGNTNTEIWMQPGCPDSRGQVYRQRKHAQNMEISVPSGIAFVSAQAANQALIVCDVLRSVFVDNRVVILQLTSETSHSLPFLLSILHVLVEHHIIVFVHANDGLKNDPRPEIVFHTTDPKHEQTVCEYLVEHDKISEAHLSGTSQHTVDHIVWGKTNAKIAENKANGIQRIGKQITTFSASSAPIVIVPGAWTEAEIFELGRNVASAASFGFGFNVSRGCAVISPKDWRYRDLFWESVEFWLSELRVAPILSDASLQQYNDILKYHPKTTKHHLSGNKSSVNWGIIPNVDLDKQENVKMLTDLHRVPLIADVPLSGQVPLDPQSEYAMEGDNHIDQNGFIFLENSLFACNQMMQSKASVSIYVHPRVQVNVKHELESMVAQFQQSCVVLNDIPDLGFVMQSAVINNHTGHMFDFPSKAVVRSPFTYPKAGTTPIWRHPTIDKPIERVFGLVQFHNEDSFSIQSSVSAVVGTAMEFLSSLW